HHNTILVHNHSPIPYTTLYRTYEARKVFSSEDHKKLERMEKLTKRIRNDAGGSDSDNDVGVKDIPPAMFDLIKKAADWADQLKRSEEHTSELQSPDHIVWRILF